MNTPRSEDAWYESRHGEDRDALLKECRKLELENAQLKAELAKHKGSPEWLNEALNSGDGTYKP